MAVSILTRAEATQDGVQPFDPRRHLREMADLVGRVFADELDAHGRSAVREMQTVARLSPVMGGLMQFAILEDMLSGYVWLDQGRVVGNATIQPADRTGARWRISNVAVEPEYRGRGIAMALMRECLREIAMRGGLWAILQVRADNPSARRIYDRLEFSEVCRDGLWRMAAPPTSLPEAGGDVKLAPLRSVAWRAHYELAKACQTPLAAWAQPIHSGQYAISSATRFNEWLGNLAGHYQVQRWAAWEGDQLMGVVETRAGVVGQNTLKFLVHPDARGRLEEALVTRGLRHLTRAGGPTSVEHDAGHIEGAAALETAGFHPQRILVTMRRRIKPGDRDL